MSIKRHTLQNLAGSLVPIVVALVTVPIYLHIIGPARYGILSIVWLFLGYFGLFDLGLARASSYHIARLHDAEPAARASVFYTALAVNAGFGILGGICLYCVAPPIFEHFFKMPEQSRQAVLAVVPWLAFAIPIATVGGVLLGALQAREAFGAANIISAMNATFAQLTPLIVAWLHGPDIGWLVISVVLVRSFGLLPFAAVAYRKLPLGAGGTFDIAQIRALFSYGGWIMITNIMDPIMTTMDRMLIAGVIGADAVAYYSVPYNLVSRISTLPGALASSLFPRLSRHETDIGAQLATDATIGLAAIITPIIVTSILVLPIFMRLWVGENFALKSVPVGMILLVGIWVNSLAFIPYSQIQASNRPDITAKFHLVEVVPFLVILWLGVKYAGLPGAAAAWSFRVVIDAILLFFASKQLKVFIRIWPGFVLLLIALGFAPDQIFSLKMGFACLLIILSVFWAFKIEPRLYNMMNFS